MKHSPKCVDGRRLRDQGCDDVLAAATAAHRDWLLHAEQKLNEFACSGRYFTSEDVIKDLDGEPHHRNAIGALIAVAARRGEIQRIGSVQAKHRAARARWIGLWKGTQRLSDTAPKCPLEWGQRNQR